MRCRRTQRLSGTGTSTARHRRSGTMWLISAFCGRAGRSSLPIGRSRSARTTRRFRRFGISSMVAYARFRATPRTKSAPLAFQCLPFQNKADCAAFGARFARGICFPSHSGESPSRDGVDELRKAETVRYCSAKSWRPWMFRFAAMVPHPSFYVRRECFERLGGYSLDYRICADFELELRYLYLAKLKAAYLPECVVVMRMGGMSTAGWRSNIVINREDLRALRANGVWSCLPLIYLKYLFKIWGFVFKRG